MFLDPLRPPSHRTIGDVHGTEQLRCTNTSSMRTRSWMTLLWNDLSGFHLSPEYRSSFTRQSELYMARPQLEVRTALYWLLQHLRPMQYSGSTSDHSPLWTIDACNSTASVSHSHPEESPTTKVLFLITITQHHYPQSVLFGTPSHFLWYAIYDYSFTEQRWQSRTERGKFCNEIMEAGTPSR